MQKSAATKIPRETERRAQRAAATVRLKMADLLRIGLDRVLNEIESTGELRIPRTTPEAQRP